VIDLLSVVAHEIIDVGEEISDKMCDSTNEED
jgi:hypothetical protein